MKFLQKIGAVLCAALLWQSAAADDLENLIQSKTAPQTQTQPQAAQSDANDLIRSAMGLLGVAYRFGGTSPKTGMDCSGFMQYIFRKSLHVNLPRTAAEQSKMGVAVSRSDLQPGDMVFFNTSGRRVSHVGLYIGGNRFIHAPRTGKTIEITSLGNRYWSARFVGARRVKPYNSGRFTN
ncbi:MAG: C40 family peptidase [Neisseria sp.]|nr:C40 family peptidase [Neisseria sp.]